MAPLAEHRYRSIFSDSTPDERRQNFEDYLVYACGHGGEILELDKDLTRKREQLNRFRAHPVRSHRPLDDPAAFYRNHVIFRDDPATIDRKTLLWTCVYKFARHEWVGISAAWEASPRLADAADDYLANKSISSGRGVLPHPVFRRDVPNVRA